MGEYDKIGWRMSGKDFEVSNPERARAKKSPISDSRERRLDSEEDPQLPNHESINLDSREPLASSSNEGRPEPEEGFKISNPQDADDVSGNESKQAALDTVATDYLPSQLPTEHESMLNPGQVPIFQDNEYPYPSSHAADTLATAVPCEEIATVSPESQTITDGIEMKDRTDTTELERHRESLERTRSVEKPLSVKEESDDIDQEQRTENEFKSSFPEMQGSIKEARKAARLNGDRFKVDTYRPSFFAAVNNSTSEETEISNNVHILGNGNIGKFIAHSLAGMANPPQVTLLLHDVFNIAKWYEEGEAITLYSGKDYETRSNFLIESSINFPFDPNETYSGYGPNEETPVVPPDSVIDHLIITTKVRNMIEALNSVKSRLRPTSTICFIHNGLGIMEEVNELVFPDRVTRPNYIFGSISHGVGSVAERKFSCTINGNGALNLCKIDSSHKDDSSMARREITGYAPTARFLLRTLTRCDSLFAKGYLYNEFLILQLEKLAVNAVINPLTVMFDCPNGALLYNHHITNTIHSLLREISRILLTLPELHDPALYTIPQRINLEKRLNERNLYHVVASVCKKTGGNLSSTLQDVRKGQVSEIRWINGWLKDRGKELGLETKLNELMVNVVDGKGLLARREKANHIPFWRPTKL